MNHEAPAPTSDAVQELDGRRRRGQDNRARIVAAMMELVRGGEVSPTAEQVSARADVGLRTVFRHFQDMESLYREISMTVAVQARPQLNVPFRAADWQGRMVEMVGRRAAAYEVMAPFKRAGDAFRHRSKYLGSDYTMMVEELRRVLERELPAEIRADTAKVEALDLLLSFEAWSRLRREQRLPAERVVAVLEGIVRSVLGLPAEP
jgi:AcrR family transcriptional regulator